MNNTNGLLREGKSEISDSCVFLGQERYAVLIIPLIQCATCAEIVLLITYPYFLQLREDRRDVVGSKDSLWPLDPLITGCCSDDETDAEESAALDLKVCNIRRYEWRSARMDYILDKIDEYRDKRARSSPGSTPGGNPY